MTRPTVTWAVGDHLHDTMETQPIREADIDRLCLKDADMLRTEVAAVSPPTVTRFAIIPTFDCHIMRHQGSYFTCKRVKGRASEIHGAQMGSPDDPDNWGFVLWIPRLSDDLLRITRLRAPTPTHFRSLAAAASAEAAWWGFKRCSVAGISPDLLAGSDLEPVQATESLPGYAWFDGVDQVHWQSPEPYTACKSVTHWRGKRSCQPNVSIGDVFC